MPLSVPSSNSGPGLSSLLRQARQAKADDAAPTASDQPTAVSVRPLGRSGIDSTERGTAQITAALTVYLSKLGGSDDPPAARAPAGKPAATAGVGSSPRSGAADLLRTLDAYRERSGQRLTA